MKIKPMLLAILLLGCFPIHAERPSDTQGAADRAVDLAGVQRRFELISRFEGLALKVHSDGRGAEIGYGHELLAGERYPQGISERQAYVLYLVDVARAEAAVRRLAPQANQNQFDALVDFTYEMGTGALARLLSHGWARVPAELPRWRCINHRPVAGLEIRRRREVELFVAPVKMERK